MEELESKGLDCSDCRGNCCSYEANSMMVTPIEARDLVLYLRKRGELTDELKLKCQDVVRQYRLNHPTGDGRRSFIRRTYTCPFFGHKELGCPLPREVKPYGCLAFNAHHTEKKADEHCYSEKELLMQRESANPQEEKINQELRTQLCLIWEKTPLPLALLELWDKDLGDEVKITL